MAVIDWPARLAMDLLLSVEACYSAPGAPLLPARSGVLFGTTPALDCPMLSVVLTSIEARSGPGTPSNRCTAIPRARLTIWVARCYPVMDESGTPPALAAEEESALLLDTDLGLIWDGLIVRWGRSELFPSFPGLDCEAVTIGVAAAVGPSGGIAAWQIPVTVDLAVVR